MEKSAAKKIPEEIFSKIELMAYQLSPHPCATLLKEEFWDEKQLWIMDYAIRIGWDREYVFSVNGRELTNKFKFFEMMDG